MKGDYIFHVDNVWKWNKFPDKPPLYWTATIEMWEKQVAELKASALDVANPELIEDVKLPFLADEVRLYEWPGKVEIGVQLKGGGDDGGQRSSVQVAVLSLPKPEADLIFIDGDFNNSYESRIQASKNKNNRKKKMNHHSDTKPEADLKNKISKERFLSQTSFKNVSGNWQFKGDMTPERVFRIFESLKNSEPPQR